VKQSLADIQTLEPAKRNVKTHDLAAIKASIRRFGFGAPLITDTRTGRLVGGHGRVDALREMRDAGEEPPAGVRLIKKGKRWKVPVFAWTSSDDDEADAFAIALNRVQDAGGYDLPSLEQLAAVLGPDGLAGTGFTEAEIDSLVRAGTIPNDGATSTDRDQLPKDPAPLGQSPKGDDAPHSAGNTDDLEVRTIHLEGDDAWFERISELLAIARADHHLDSNTEALEAVLASRYPNAAG
jgi:hypothetical protein